MKVYKVVRKKGDTYLSAIESKWQVQYTPGKELTFVHGPLFAFDNIEDAKMFAGSNCSYRRLCIFEAEAEIYGPTPEWIIDALFMDYKDIVEFWKDGKGASVFAPQGTVLCSSITLGEKIC